MKKFLLFSLLVGLFGEVRLRLKPIKLNQPNVKRGLPVMTALQKRQSTREYADKNGIAGFVGLVVGCCRY